MIRGVKGTRDLLPPDSFWWGRVEEIARAIFGAYGYEEIRTPILEETQLFVRGIGEGTDIVHKEMYTFADKKGRSVTMRPEMTAGVVRAFIEHGMAQGPLPRRLWYTGPMFRYERPQKGRFRQFHQVGAELLGCAGPEGDAEMIAAIFAFLRRLRFSGLVLRINSVGDAACRPAYVEALRSAASERSGRLCADCVRRMETNPLRLLDCKVAGCREVAAELPRPTAFLCEPCRTHAGKVAELLAGLDLPVETDESLVRGLDYYTRTVFEVSAAGLGSQDAILGGGRYDRLVAELEGGDVPAVGFAAGLDRILDILPEEFRRAEVEALDEKLVVVPIGSTSSLYAFRVAEAAREAGLDVTMELLGRGPKGVLSRAVKEGFRYAALVGESERDARTVTLKDLVDQAQRVIPLARLAEVLEHEGAERFAARFLAEREAAEGDDDDDESAGPDDLDAGPPEDEKWN